MKVVSSSTRYVVDTSLINKLVDGIVGADELPTDGTFVASHIQLDELKRTKDPERREALLRKFHEIVGETLPTESFVLDISRLEEARLGDGAQYEVIKRELDSRNRGKRNNAQDALIGEIALKNGYVLLVADFDLYQVMEGLGCGVMYWSAGSRIPRGIPPPESAVCESQLPKRREER
jgi:predicted nucleic acid-binding protein